MQIDNDVVRLIYEMNAQYAGAYTGDPEATYDKILAMCNHNLDAVAAHFEYAENVHQDLYGGDNAPQGRRSS